MRENCTSGSERGKPRKGLTYLPKFVLYDKTLREDAQASIWKYLKILLGQPKNISVVFAGK